MGCIAMIPSCPFTVNSFVFNETPIGDNNCANLIYSTQNEFISDTLKIRLDGRNLDAVDFVIGGDNKSFTIVLNPTDRDRLNKPLRSNESLRVDYIKATATLTGCVLSL